MISYPISEWEQLFNMAIGTNMPMGNYDVTRVPGGVLYKYVDITSNHIQYYHGGPSDYASNSSVSITFCPFPPGLVEKLNLL